MKAQATWLLAGVVACSGSEPTPADDPLLPDQGATASVRHLSGDRALDALVVESGLNRADPDSASLTYFLNLLPGPVTMSVTWDGHVATYTTPEVEPDALCATQLVTTEAAVASYDDVAAAHTITADGFSVDIPAGAAKLADDPVTGPYTVSSIRLDADSAVVSPGTLVSVRNDDDLEPIELMDAVWLRGRVDDDDRNVSLSEFGTLIIDLGATGVLDDPEGWSLYSYATGRGLWTRGADVVIDPVEGTATAEIKILGWWAIGRPATDRQGCVQGRVVDPAGQGITGPEVRLHARGRATVDRRTALAGTFCLPTPPGEAATLDLFGMSLDRGQVFFGQRSFTADAGVAACGSDQCTDLGLIGVDAFPDADGDGYFTGPGGDCDDSDAEVNPSPGLGDGSWCGDGQ